MTTISLLTGLVGALAALIAVCWTVWWELSAWHPRISYSISFSRYLNSSNQDEHGLTIVVYNRNRTPLILDGVGIWGAALANDPTDWWKRAAATRKRASREERRASARLRDTTSIGPKRGAIRIDPLDAERFQIPCPWPALLRIPGQFWGAVIATRTGKQWMIDGVEISDGYYAWIPRWLIHFLSPDRRRLLRTPDYRRRLSASQAAESPNACGLADHFGLHQEMATTSANLPNDVGDLRARDSRS